jgi:hypothetical protein
MRLSGRGKLFVEDDAHGSQGSLLYCHCTVGSYGGIRENILQAGGSTGPGRSCHGRCPPSRTPRSSGGHCRFRNNGTESLSKSGMRWINCSAKRQCDLNPDCSWPDGSSAGCYGTPRSPTVPPATWLKICLIFKARTSGRPAPFSGPLAFAPPPPSFAPIGL